MDLQDFKNALAYELFGETQAQAQDCLRCLRCKKPALERCYSQAGRDEYNISGICERCFDAMFKEEDYE